MGQEKSKRKIKNKDNMVRQSVISEAAQLVVRSFPMEQTLVQAVYVPLVSAR